MDYTQSSLQAHNAQRIYRNGIYAKADYKRVSYNSQVSVKGVRRIIRKRGELAEQLKEPAVKGKRVKPSKSGSLKAAEYVLKDGWLLEPVSDGKLPSYYR